MISVWVAIVVAVVTSAIVGAIAYKHGVRMTVLRALETMDDPARTKSVSDVIARWEADPERRAALDLARAERAAGGGFRITGGGDWPPADREPLVMTEELRAELLRYCDPDDVPPVGTVIR